MVCSSLSDDMAAMCGGIPTLGTGLRRAAKLQCASRGNPWPLDVHPELQCVWQAVAWCWAARCSSGHEAALPAKERSNASAAEQPTMTAALAGTVFTLMGMQKYCGSSCWAFLLGQSEVPLFGFVYICNASLFPAVLTGPTCKLCYHACCTCNEDTNKVAGCNLCRASEGFCRSCTLAAAAGGWPAQCAQEVGPMGWSVT
jgi:hypothetical protein